MSFRHTLPYHNSLKYIIPNEKFIIKNYEDEMLKNSTCRAYSKWNLIDTGKLLFNKISRQLHRKKSSANVIIVRPDYFHLKTFAKYLYI